MTADKTAAKYGETVTLTVKPENDDYMLKTLTVKDANNGNVTVTDNKFTMPASNVTVSATFGQKSSAAVSLAVTGNEGTTCKASLLNSEYDALTSSQSIKEGDKFILSVSMDDDYDYNITGFDPAPDGEWKNYIESFNNKDYMDYINYIQENNISVPSNTYMYWVTMPDITTGNLTINITFAKAKTYTILYQSASGNPSEVWCKCITKVNSVDIPFTLQMRRDAAMGDKAVWSVKVPAAFAPTKVAFATTKTDVESIQNGNMTDCSKLSPIEWTPTV